MNLKEARTIRRKLLQHARDEILWARDSAKASCWLACISQLQMAHAYKAMASAMLVKVRELQAAELPPIPERVLVSPETAALLAESDANMTPEGEPERFWWLSFCDPTKPEGTQFLGVVVAGPARRRTQAIALTHKLKINPGGEVATVSIPSNFLRVIPDRWRNRLLDKGETDALSKHIDAVFPR